MEKRESNVSKQMTWLILVGVKFRRAKAILDLVQNLLESIRLQLTTNLLDRSEKALNLIDLNLLVYTNKLLPLPGPVQVFITGAELLRAFTNVH